jgi:hypothetical protein
VWLHIRVVCHDDAAGSASRQPVLYVERSLSLRDSVEVVCVLTVGREGVKVGCGEDFKGLSRAR